VDGDRARALVGGRKGAKDGAASAGASEGGREGREGGRAAIFFCAARQRRTSATAPHRTALSPSPVTCRGHRLRLRARPSAAISPSAGGAVAGKPRVGCGVCRRGKRERKALQIVV
jgi:hypothetical protein